MYSIHLLCSLALAGAVVVTAFPSTASAQVCYQQPFPSSIISSPWGDTAGRPRPHQGVDFAVGVGTAVPAAGDGVVVLVSSNSCLGNYVVTRHADGMYTSFGHLQRVTVSQGASVTLGQTVALSGNTGSCTTGPHVHMVMSTNQNGSGNFDPIAYMAARSAGSGCGCAMSESCAVALLQEQPSVYAPPSSTDIDGDGRADVCARGASGVRCWLARDEGWSEEIPTVPWGDAAGWDNVTNYATLRMGDLDGDGRADLCGRSNSDGYLCALSNGAGFDAATTWNPGFRDVDSWNLPGYYTTLRLADIDGDGRQDLCGRSSEGIDCRLSDGSGFRTTIAGPRLSDASGWNNPWNYGTIRFGDIDGDGRDDLCARAGAGIRCWLSEGDGFGPSLEGPEWSDAAGWNHLQYWSTIRLADIDGDGLDDICARSGSDYRCHQSLGDGMFATGAWIVAALSDESGWNDRSNYATLRVGDVDGDGADDICGRANARVVCWAMRPGEGETPTFEAFEGPTWSDESGWSAAQYYQTIRLADVDGDGTMDVCTRTSTDWRCHTSTGIGFTEGIINFAEFASASGWSAPQYWSTIMSAGPSCRPRNEECNGRDDDCDGVIDESACGVDAGPDASFGMDAGFAEDVGDIDAGDRPAPSPGCGCSVDSRSTPTAWLFALLVGATLRRRGRWRAR